MDIHTAKRCMMLHMRLHNIPVLDLHIERVQDNNIDYWAPTRWQRTNGLWTPIIKWTFVSFEPTVGQYRIRCDKPVTTQLQQWLKSIHQAYGW